MKRFYQSVAAAQRPEGWAIELDGRLVRTPGRRLLAVRGRALADAIAAEWRGQGDKVEPDTMRITRLANTTIDQMPERRDAALAEIMGFATSDLLCCRAAMPADLVERQAAAWQPWLDWSARVLDAPLRSTTAVTPIVQPADAVAALGRHCAAFDDWRLVGLHAAVRGTGSVVLGLAMARGELDAVDAFRTAMLDELYEIEQWGLEEEQESRHEALRTDLEAAALYLALLEP